MITLERLRLAGFLLGAALILGELWRSWGVARPLAFLIDDLTMGSVLIISAGLMTRDTTRRRAFFASAWAMIAGMLYDSFFRKIVTPETTEAGNWDSSILTIMIGVAFVTSCVGMIAVIALPRE